MLPPVTRLSLTVPLVSEMPPPETVVLSTLPLLRLTLPRAALISTLPVEDLRRGFQRGREELARIRQQTADLHVVMLRHQQILPRPVQVRLAIFAARHEFHGRHPLGRSILGREDTIRSLRRRDLMGYIDAHYDPAQIVITCGAQQGISLCAQLLVGPGERVAIEDPGYRAAGAAFAMAGARLQGIAVDAEGLDVAVLERVADCRLVYVTPAHQYPSGVTLSLARRLQLLDWAERHDSWIVEDDYDGEYRYSGAPLAPLAALDRGGRVIHVGTFCKIAFPALRLGYLVLPPALAQPFARRRALDMRHSDLGSQAVMAEFIAAGHFQRHIRRMRAAARRRRDALLAGWPEGISGCAPLPAVDAGLHLCVRVDGMARERALLAAATRAGVELNGLSRYWLPDGATPADARAGLVLGFAAVPEDEIARALLALRQAWGVGG